MKGDAGNPLGLPDHIPDSDAAAGIFLDAFQRACNIADFRRPPAGRFADVQVSAAKPDGG